jgi:hypothetical protein
MIRIALLLGVVAGCKTLNSQSCEILDNQGTEDCPLDGQQRCTETSQCAMGVCDTAVGLCVECLIESDCAVGVCNASHVCERCDDHADCDSHACDFGSGTCIDEGTIAYVTSGGLGTGALGCLKDAPCSSINEALIAAKPNIKFEGTDKVTVTTEQLITTAVRILADKGAALARGADGTILKIDGAVVLIEDLEIRDGGGSSGHAIELGGTGATLTLDRVMIDDNEGSGILSSEGELVMRRCIVALNLKGGVLHTGKLDITNSIFVLNGSPGSSTGGLRFTSEAPGSIFKFNTVANNSTDGTNTGQAAVNCDLGGNLDASSNIIADNTLDDLSCTFDFSLFAGTAPVPSKGTGNKSGMAMFASITDQHLATFYRIATGSAAIDSANPADAEPIDIDGDSRPAAKDMGADELVP